VLYVETQFQYDANNKPFTHKFEAVNRTLIPAIVLKNLSFGFDAVIADMFWISSIQDLIQWNEKDHFYVQYFDNISTLDPRFEYPYLFGIFVVPTSKSPTYIDEMATISERGITALPDNWKIPFYLSTKYKALTKDYERASHYLEIAVNRDSAPQVVKDVYQAFKKNEQQDKREVSAMIKVIYDTTDNETIKKLAARGIVINELTTMLEKGIARYKIKYQVFPKSLSELERVNYVLIPVAVKDAFDVVISEDGGFKIVEKK
jgi:hypothetical protein